MEAPKFDDLIAVRIFKNDTEQQLFYVEQGTVGDAKKLLEEAFHQKGSLRWGPLLLKSDRLLQLGCIYSYYLTDTGMDLFHRFKEAITIQYLYPKPWALHHSKDASVLKQHELCGAALA